MSSMMDLIPTGVPASPSSNASSADSPTLPRTPQSPLSGLPTMSVDAAASASALSTMTTADVNAAAIAAAKRKPSRRANTAERRATHNAVERQRRETLNSRFLDLAALLPNLSQIRRPSKSAIVNSSIAHVHASRRHRMLAARELRLVRLEAEALRREINQWRERAGLPGVEEPPRSDAFALILSGDLELEAELANLGPGFEGFPAGSGPAFDEEDEFDDAEDYMPMQQPMNHGPAALHAQQQAAAAATMMQLGLGPVGVTSPTVEQSNPLASLPASAHASRGSLSVRTSAPMMHHSAAMSPMSASFDNTAAVLMGQYEAHRLLPHGHPAHFTQQPTSHFVQSAIDDHKWAQHHLAGAYTPPASAHGPSPQQAALAQLAARQQALHHQRMLFGGGSPVEDDGVGSAPGTAHGRARSGSTASFNSSPRGAYEVASSIPINIPHARLRERGLNVNTTPGSWDSVGSPLGQGMMANMSMKASPGGHAAMAAMAGMF